MESNREEAERCLSIAQKALAVGNHNKAIKFLKKSLSLFPSSKAKDLLEKLESDDASSKNTVNNEAKKNFKSMPDLSELHGRAQNATPAYTPQQKELAQRINKCNDYYEILGVERSATDIEIKKAYRKMALQLHPDKNTAPGSTEAFKAVGKAFAVLSDADKRQRYDMYGADGVDTGVRRRRRSSSSGSEYEDEPYDAQEIFNMFFGGGFPGENVRVFRRGNTYYYDRRGRRHGAHHHQQENQMGAILQLLPFLIVFLLTIASRLFVPLPAYSLSHKTDYNYARKTSNLRVLYYTKSDFEKEYPKGSVALRRLEEEVEESYINNLQNSCYQERVNKENLRHKGIYFGRKDFVDRADKMATPSCEKIQKLFNKHR